MKNEFDFWKQHSKLKYSFYFVAIVLGLIQAWGYRHVMNADGLSYVDIAYNYLNGNYNDVINTYWFPAYIWLIALVLYIFNPNTYWEFTIIHGLNFTLFIVALIAFNYFLKEFIALINRLEDRRENGSFRISNKLLIALGYTLFIWISLKFVTVWIVAPDMLLSVFLYFSYGLLISINRSPSKNKFFILAFILGIAYLVKPTMLWLGLFFFIGVFFATKINKNYIPTVLMSFIVFLITLSPYVFIMSSAKDRLTFADNGKLMILWEINQVEPVYMVNWQGGNPQYGKPIHPSRKIFSNPDIFEFGYPISGSYPLWYDPTYWHEGATPQLNFTEMLRPFKAHYKDYIAIYVAIQGILLLGAMYLLLLSLPSWKTIFKSQIFFLLPSFAGLVLISVILPELRYLSAFVITLWLAIYSSATLPKISERLSVLVPKVVIALLFFTLIFAKFYPSDFSFFEYAISTIKGKEYYEHENYNLARELQKMGFEKEKVATVGHGHLSFWAHLGQHKIVAEIPTGELKDFWKLPKDKFQQAMKSLSLSGARFLFAYRIPDWAVKDGWTQVGNTESYIYLLN